MPVIVKPTKSMPLSKPCRGKLWHSNLAFEVFDDEFLVSGQFCVWPIQDLLRMYSCMYDVQSSNAFVGLTSQFE